ncbi:hypothetical protein [Actinomadura macra]|uniref:hypothetical protein n=1 Tax=Actinomadura macra TaxID=46164 RepID=UPI000829E78E|nr:hypothetical protein [Actinomadura macra]
MSEDALPAVGARSRSAPHVAGVRDATADPQYAVEPSVLLRLLEQVRPSGDAELMSLRWDRQAPRGAVRGDGDSGTSLHGESTSQAEAAVRLEATVTRRIPGAGPAHVAIHQSVHLVDERDRVLSRSSVAWSVPVTLSRNTAVEWEATDFASLRWGGRLRERLAEDPRFARTTRSFDGAIALAAPDRQVHFRIYRGVVLDVTRKSLDGATFAIEGTDLAWLDLLAADTNDFIRRTSDGQFRAQGSGYQYLRMIKAVMLMIDHARALAREVTTHAPTHEIAHEKAQEMAKETTRA